MPVMKRLVLRIRSVVREWNGSSVKAVRDTVTTCTFWMIRNAPRKSVNQAANAKRDWSLPTELALHQLHARVSMVARATSTEICCQLSVKIACVTSLVTSTVSKNRAGEHVQFTVTRITALLTESDSSFRALVRMCSHKANPAGVAFTL